MFNVIEANCKLLEVIHFTPAEGQIAAEIQINGKNLNYAESFKDTPGGQGSWYVFMVELQASQPIESEY